MVSPHGREIRLCGAELLPPYPQSRKYASASARLFAIAKGAIMPDLDSIRLRLGDANLARVAELAGVPYHSLYRFVRQGAEPRYETVAKLAEYLEARDGAANG